MISLFFINGFILFISIFSVGFSTVALFHLINFFFSVYLSVCLPACLSVILPNWIASNTIFEILIIYFVWTISQNKSNFWCISLKIRNGFVIVTRVSNQKKKSKKKWTGKLFITLKMSKKCYPPSKSLNFLKETIQVIKIHLNYDIIFNVNFYCRVNATKIRDAFTA